MSGYDHRITPTPEVHTKSTPVPKIGGSCHITLQNKGGSCRITSCHIASHHIMTMYRYVYIYHLPYERLIVCPRAEVTGRASRPLFGEGLVDPGYDVILGYLWLSGLRKMVTSVGLCLYIATEWYHDPNTKQTSKQTTVP